MKRRYFSLKEYAEAYAANMDYNRHELSSWGTIRHLIQSGMEEIYGELMPVKFQEVGSYLIEIPITPPSKDPEFVHYLLENSKWNELETFLATQNIDMMAHSIHSM